MKKGFTLIELLAVVAIIAILASVVIVQTGAARQRSRESKQKADLKTVQSALEVYFEANGKYPEAPVACPPSGIVRICGEMPAFGSRGYTGPQGWVPDLAPTYLAVLPSNPLRLRPAAYSVQQAGATACSANTTGYAYLVNTAATDYKIISHCSVERAIEVGDPFRDSNPVRTWAYAIYSSGAVGTNW